MNDIYKKNEINPTDTEADLRELSTEDLAELEALEKRLEMRLASITVPEPSREDTYQMIEFIKTNGGNEKGQASEDLDLFQFIYPKETLYSRSLGLIRSQWNAYGFRSWMTTGAAIVATGYISSAYHTEEYNDLFLWTLGLTLIILGTIVYAFRPRDKGTMILEQLGKYSMLEQTLTRLILVMIFQMIVATPLSFVFLEQGLQPSLFQFIIGWSIPVISVALICFVLLQWLGAWKAVLMLFVIGFVGFNQNKRSHTVEMITFSGSNDYYLLRWSMLFTAIGLFIIYLLNQRKRGME